MEVLGQAGVLCGGTCRTSNHSSLHQGGKERSIETEKLKCKAMRSLRNFLLLGGSQTLPERPSTQQSHSSSEIPKGPECPGPESEKQGHSFKPQSGWKAHFQIPCRIPHLVFSTGDKEDLTWTIDPNLPPSSILPSFSIINTCPKNLSSQCHNSFMCS